MALICGAELVVPNQSQCNDGRFLSRTIVFNCGRCLSSAVLTTFRMDGVGYQRQWRVVRRRLASYGAANADPEESTEESVEDPEESVQNPEESARSNALFDGRVGAVHTREVWRSRAHSESTQRIHTANPAHTRMCSRITKSHTHTLAANRRSAVQ